AQDQSHEAQDPTDAHIATTATATAATDEVAQVVVDEATTIADVDGVSKAVDE
ncbi:hypothetical protein Dimus_020039, partial [Dionaea muscipula]